MPQDLKTILFKYLTIDRIDILQNQLIRLTQSSDFNDPFELNPSFDLMSKGDMAALPDAPGGGKFLTPEVIQKMMQAVLPVLQKNQQLYAAHPGVAFSIHNNDIGRTHYDTNYGILCLTEVHDNLLMWAHYADHHRGFVIGLDEHHAFFTGSEIVAGCARLGSVEYNNKRPVLSISTRDTPKVYFRKSTDWSYEREVRLIRPLSESIKAINRGASPPIHLFELPHTAIKKIFTGAQMRQDDYRALCEFCTSTPSLSHVQIHHMQLSKDHYQLETTPPLNGDTEQMRSGHVPSAREFDV